MVKEKGKAKRKEAEIKTEGKKSGDVERRGQAERQRDGQGVRQIDIQANKNKKDKRSKQIKADKIE